MPTRHHPPSETPCTECTAPVPLDTKRKRDAYNQRGRVYCSTECRDRWVRRQSSERMARTNRKYASQRMTERNPMRNEASREKMRATLLEMKHQPRERGGNGTGPTVPQARLAELLGWPMEVVFKTGYPRVKGGPPGHYKLDIANEAAKVAVEVDGGSHCSLARRESDRRKDEILAGAGWLVLRFSNAAVLADPEGIAADVLSTTSKWLARTPT